MFLASLAEVTIQSALSNTKKMCYKPNWHQFRQQLLPFVIKCQIFTLWIHTYEHTLSLCLSHARTHTHTHTLTHTHTHVCVPTHAHTHAHTGVWLSHISLEQLLPYFIQFRKSQSIWNLGTLPKYTHTNSIPLSLAHSLSTTRKHIHTHTHTHTVTHTLTLSHTHARMHTLKLGCGYP